MACYVCTTWSFRRGANGQLGAPRERRGSYGSVPPRECLKQVPPPSSGLLKRSRDAVPRKMCDRLDGNGSGAPPSYHARLLTYQDCIRSFCHARRREIDLVGDEPDGAGVVDALGGGASARRTAVAVRFG